jgi:hypothetical protein
LYWLFSSLTIGLIDWSVSWLVHADFTFGMLVDTETESIFVEVVDGVEMLEECITNEEEVLILTWKSALVDDKVAFMVA